MLVEDATGPSSEEWFFPIVLAPKEDVFLRFCVNSKKQNSITVSDKHPMMGMKKYIVSSPKANQISVFDIKDGYCKTQMD